MLIVTMVKAQFINATPHTQLGGNNAAANTTPMTRRSYCGSSVALNVLVKPMLRRSPIRDARSTTMVITPDVLMYPLLFSPNRLNSNIPISTETTTVVCTSPLGMLYPTTMSTNISVMKSITTLLKRAFRTIVR